MDDVVHLFTTLSSRRDPEHRVIRVRARDIFLGYANEDAMLKAQAKVAKMSNAEFANLPRQIILDVDKPYMITANIDVIDGLVNGAVGTLKTLNEASMVREEKKTSPGDCGGTSTVPRQGSSLAFDRPTQ
ncbi:hypothetical protein HPB49_025801 [Dermacentor silvarum]|nr:hypothetical protein HPB49_025801 [Dermacentor silvarum]